MWRCNYDFDKVGYHGLVTMAGYGSDGFPWRLTRDTMPLPRLDEMSQCSFCRHSGELIDHNILQPTRGCVPRFVHPQEAVCQDVHTQESSVSGRANPGK